MRPNTLDSNRGRASERRPPQRHIGHFSEQTRLYTHRAHACTYCASRLTPTPAAPHLRLDIFHISYTPPTPAMTVDESTQTNGVAEQSGIWTVQSGMSR